MSHPLEENILASLCDLAPTLGLHPPGRLFGDFGAVMISALAYGKGERFQVNRDNPQASLAPFAQKNYYREMVRRLKILTGMAEKELGTSLPPHRIFCNSPLPEKELAQASGLGKLGKNSLIFLPRQGSLFVLGGIFFPAGGQIGEDLLRSFTPMPQLPVPLPEPGEICGNCTACIRACPTGAIGEGGQIDRRLCIQAYTAEPIPVPPKIREKWGPVLYGCQVCQEVCPLNRHPPAAADTTLGILGAGVSLAAILEAPETSLKKTLLRGTVLDRSWISELALRRNALFAAGHQGALGLLPLIASYLHTDQPLLRDAARWAYREIRKASDL